MAKHAADKAACRLAGAEEGKKIVCYTAACTVVAGPTAAAPKAGIAPVQTLSRSFSVEHGVELDPKQLEAAKQPGLWRRVTLYHAFFTGAVTSNLAMLALTTSGAVQLGRLNSGAVGLIVLCLSCLMRSELFLAALYWSTCALGRALPCSLRAWLAWVPFQAPGGLHSGCAVAGFAWELVYAIQWWLLPVKGPGLTSSLLGLLASASCLLLVLLLAAMLVLSVPTVRHRHHNSFELSHRYAGWALVAVTWVHIWTAAAFFARYNSRGQPLPRPSSTGAVLLRDADLWCTLAITLLVFHPWACVRRRTVAAAVPHPHSCLVLSGFPGHAPAGTAGRISTHWAGQWHSFAAVSGPRDSGCALAEAGSHAMVIAPAGDWTRARVAEAAQQAEPRTAQVYVRLIRAPGSQAFQTRQCACSGACAALCHPTAAIPLSSWMPLRTGFMYTTRMWERIVVVASGAGIAPVLPCVLQHTAASIFVLWIASRPESFGPIQQTLEESLGRDKLWIHDTSTEGRPDVLELTLQAVKKEQAQAMYVVSNLRLTYMLVRGCRAAGVPSYGAIWDS